MAFGTDPNPEVIIIFPSRCAARSMHNIHCHSSEIRTPQLCSWTKHVATERGPHPEIGPRTAQRTLSNRRFAHMASTHSFVGEIPPITYEALFFQPGQSLFPGVAKSIATGTWALF